MFRRNMPILFIVLTLVLSTAAGAQTKLRLRFTLDVESMVTMNSTMISGEKDMLLIDSQFSLSQAHRLWRRF